MKSLLPMAVAVATASFVPTSIAGPSDSALENANGNAKFLRCGTEHPSAADAAKKKNDSANSIVKRRMARSLIVPAAATAMAVAAVEKNHHPRQYREPVALSSTRTSISSAMTTAITVLALRVRCWIKCRC